MTAKEVIEKVESWLTRPAGWLISGILLILLSSGALSFSNDNATFSFGATIGKEFEYLFTILGIVLITIGATAVSVRWKHNRHLIQSILLFFWVMATAIITVQYLRGDGQLYPFTYVKYDYSQNKAHVGLDKPYLNRIKFAKYVLAATPADLDEPIFDRNNVIFSSPMIRPQSGTGLVEISLDCSDIAPSLDIGSSLRVYLIGVGEDVEIEKGVTRIGDIDTGGSGILRRYRTDIGIFEVNYDLLSNQFAQLSKEEQSIFLDKIGVTK